MVSVGYMVHEYESSSEKDSMRTFRLIDWEPPELRMVSIRLPIRLCGSIA